MSVRDEEYLLWPDADRERFEERAAILEHDAGEPRVLAEAEARAEVRAARRRRDDVLQHLLVTTRDPAAWTAYLQDTFRNFLANGTGRYPRIYEHEASLREAWTRAVAEHVGLLDAKHPDPLYLLLLELHHATRTVLDGHTRLPRIVVTRHHAPEASTVLRRGERGGWS